MPHATDIAIIDIDSENRILTWDAAAERELGWSSADVRHRALREVLHGVDAAIAVLRAQTHDSRAAQVASAVRTRTGHRVVVDIVALRLDSGDGLRLLVRPSLEETEDLAARHLAAIVASSDDAIVSKDLDGIVRTWNAGAERIFGYSADEMIGTSIRTIIPEDRQAEENLTLETIRRGETLDHFRTVRRRKTGELIDVSLTVSPIHGSDGRVVGASKIARDVTRVKGLEEERVRLLEETASLMETLNRVGASVASDLDRDSMVQAVTDAATQLTTAAFGAFFYNVTDLAGESYMLYTISGVPRAAFERFPMPRNTEVFAPTFHGTGTVRSADITQDQRYGHNAPHHGMPKGHLPVRSYLAVPVKTRTGDVAGGLFFGHPDVGRFTAHHERLAEGLASWAAVALENARLYTAAQRASRLKDEFLAGLSHELRTPLNAILGYARMIRSGMLPPDRREHGMEVIERNTHALAQIVEDVLDVSRIISGKLRLNVQVVELPDVIRAAVDAIAPSAAAKNIRVETILDSGTPPISGDPDRLQQILWNLLTNAVKFTPKAGKVQVLLERINSHVELSVSDTGIGIAADFVPHLFERFRQADMSTTREHGGLGLGLAITRHLVEGHGGTIEANSSGLGQGATFRVRLPLMIVHPRESDSRVHPQARTRTEGNLTHDLGGAHVLAVDDDRDALSLVSELLEAAGARVTTAHSGAQALTALEAGVPDLLVADIGMPQMDGFQLMATVRQHSDPRVRALPAVALTAYARSEDRIKALGAGFQMHLSKPVEPAELIAAVAALVRRGQS